MASAIEIYQRAYDLDYRHGDWESAEELYRDIIEEFPYSDEKEYAQVHLNRIAKLKGNPKDPEIQPVRGSGGAMGLAAFSLFLTLLVLVGTGYVGYFHFQQRKQYDSQELIIQGILSEKTGNIDNAILKYKLAQELYPESILACQSLAELYLKQGDKKLAYIEVKKWKLINPSDSNLNTFIQRVQKN